VAIETVVNGTTIIINEQTDPSWLIYLAIALITLGGIVWSNLQTRRSLAETKKSNKLFEMELENKLRPHLQFSHAETSYVNNPEPHLILRVKLKNAGNVPARKVNLYYKETNNEETIHLIKEKDEIRKRGVPLGTIQENFETRYVDISIPWKDRQEAKIVCWIEYSYFKKSNEIKVAVFRVQQGMVKVPHIWHLEEDILEAKKEWEDIKSGKRGAPI